MKKTNRVFICSKQRNKKETRKPFIVFSSDHPVIYASSRSNFSQDDDALSPGASLDPKYFPKLHYTKKRFFITSKCRHMYGVLNVDKIKN
jgi:hypothetical protein